MNYVTNRHGKVIPVDMTEIKEQTKRAVLGLKNVSQIDLELAISKSLKDNMETTRIQDLLVLEAITRNDIDCPDWTYVAARLFREGMEHIFKKNNLFTLKDYLKYGREENILISGLETGYDVDKLSDGLQYTNDMLFTYLGIKTLHDRYTKRDTKDEIFEKPQHLFMGVAMFVSNREIHKTSIALDLYDVMSNFLFMFGTPTVSNARIHNNQLSSCYIGSSPDNIEGINKMNEVISLISKVGGGVAYDYCNIRGLNSYVDGHKGASGGIVPFIKIGNSVTLAVDQLGVRKGSLAVYIEPWHIDIRAFLDLKKNSGEERQRAHDIFPALWLNDLFMTRVISDDKWFLFDPYEVPHLHSLYGNEFDKAYIEACNDPDIGKEEVMAKDIWKLFLRIYSESGTPFPVFKDTANRRNQNDHAGVIHSSNLCTEIYQNTKPGKTIVETTFVDGSVKTYGEKEEVETNNGFKLARKLTVIDKIDDVEVEYTEKKIVDGEMAVCNLGSINMSRIKSREELRRVVRIGFRGLNNIIDNNKYPTRETMLTAKSTRAVGMGLMGEAEYIANLGIVWGSEEHMAEVNDFMEHFSYYVIEASIDLAEEFEPYPLYEGSRWSKGIFPHESFVGHEDLPNYEHKLPWDKLRVKLLKHGIANGYLMAIAPTGTISNLFGTTSSVEPVYRLKWYEDNISTCLAPMTAPNLTTDNVAFYTPSFDVDQFKLIKLGAIRQKWLDQGQSLSIFINQHMTGKQVSQLIISAWKYGLKATYYYRSESPETEDESMHIAPPVECIGCQ